MSSLPSPLPQELLHAVSAPTGGRLALVLGAGCSMEAPTDLPSSATCAETIHRRLVADAVLSESDCADPTDLSAVTDAVFHKSHSQVAVVKRFLEGWDLRSPSPNNGYRLAAALLAEGAIASVATLNFDLAISHALSEVGVGTIVGVVNEPNDLAPTRRSTVYYLHRNANSTNLESWVLRTSALADEWRDHWEQIIATKVLAAPTVVFVGLGSPPAVLLDTARRIRAALPDTEFFQVDLVPRAESRVFRELNLADDHYVQRKWCGFMEDLSQRLVIEHTADLLAASHLQVKSEGLLPENVGSLLAEIGRLTLLELGRLRALWLLYKGSYRCRDEATTAHIADLVLVIANLERQSGAKARITPEAWVEFRRGNRVVSAYRLASGSGYRGPASIEALIAEIVAQEHSAAQPPLAVIATGTTAASAALSGSLCNWL